MTGYHISRPRYRIAGGEVAQGQGNPALEVMMKLTLPLFAALMMALPAFAQTVPINQEPHINTTLRAGFIADKIADTCPTLDGRKMRAVMELYSLRNYALDLGYESSEIRAFIENKDEKARGKAEAAAWLTDAGAVEGDAESFCKVGRDEMAKDSLIGQLLKDE